MNSKRIIDHIVYAVPNLDQAMDDFEKLAGIRPTFGGYHKAHGTKNALVNLSDGCYLEFLAIDQSNPIVQSDRWMGIEFVKEAKVTRWSLKSDDLQDDSDIVKAHNRQMGQIHVGERKTATGEILKWQMTLPLWEPEVEHVPFMTNWQSSAMHPTDALPEACTLVAMKFEHPSPEVLESVMQRLNCNIDISTGDEPKITAQIQCPNGLIII